MAQTIGLPGMGNPAFAAIAQQLLTINRSGRDRLHAGLKPLRGRYSWLCFVIHGFILEYKDDNDSYLRVKSFSVGRHKMSLPLPFTGVL
jgi:hypothetical protein